MAAKKQLRSLTARQRANVMTALGKRLELAIEVLGLDGTEFIIVLFDAGTEEVALHVSDCDDVASARAIMDAATLLNVAVAMR